MLILALDYYKQGGYGRDGHRRGGYGRGGHRRGGYGRRGRRNNHNYYNVQRFVRIINNYEFLA